MGRMNICTHLFLHSYEINRFLSCDDLFIVVGAGGGMSLVGTWILVLHDLEEQV